MFVHAVYFWLKPTLTAAEHRQFLQGVHALSRADAVTAGYVGGPADTHRAVVERTYSHALVAVFPDQAAHDRYQVDPVHERFRVECGSYWDKVVIYDTETR